MRIRPIVVVSKTIVVSQLRSTRTGYRSRSFFRRPAILLVIDIAAFAIPALIAYGVLNLIRSFSIVFPTLSLLSPIIVQYIASIPAFVTNALIVLGLILELSQGSQFSSTDSVNWLPITASEYVTGSNLAMIAVYSFVIMAACGALLPFALAFGLLNEWVLAFVLAALGAFLAASLMEILRTVLNRFSSSFYRRGGRFAIASRVIILVAAIVLFQAAINPNLAQRFVGPITTAFARDWFVPLFWGSASIFQLSSGNGPLSAVFGVASLALTLALFYVAVLVRSRYWVPLPVSIRVSTREYAPVLGVWKYFGLSLAQIAIAKKDLRSMVRRRETVRLLAIPAIILVAFLFGSYGAGRSSFFASGDAPFILKTFSPFFAVMFSALMFSMSSIGQEGKAVINLYYHPINATDFIVGKAVPPLIYSSAVSVAVSVLVSLLFGLSPAEAFLLLVLCIATAAEATSVGIYFGITFPDFSEGPRSRFITATGSLAGVVVGLLTTLFTLGPAFIPIGFVSHPTLAASAESAIIGLAVGSGITFAFYKLALSKTDNFLQEYPA